MTKRMKNLLLRHPEIIPTGCFPEGDYSGYPRDGEIGKCVVCQHRIALTKFNHRILSCGDPKAQLYRRVLVCYSCWIDMPTDVRTEELITLREMDDVRGTIVEISARLSRLERTMKG